MAALAKLRRELEPILSMAKLDPAAMALLRDCVECEAGLDRLQEAGELVGAARLGAFALPRREAVWWAGMCAVHTAPSGQPEIEVKAREAAELWVRQQDDTTRRAAMDLARQAGFGTPEAWVAVAAF